MIRSARLVAIASVVCLLAPEFFFPARLSARYTGAPAQAPALAPAPALAQAPALAPAQAPALAPGAQIAPTDLQSPALIGSDAVPDVVIGMGPGGGTVRVLSGVDGSDIGSGPPFGAAFTGGVRVAAGDVNGDGVADVITAMATGGSLVRIFDGNNAAIIATFTAFDPAFAGGVHVAAGDLNGDGRADIVAGQGLGGGLVRIFDGADCRELGAGFPFGAAFTGGVSVALGDVTGDGRLDFITGMALGGLVRVFDGVTIADVGSGFPYGPLYLGGVAVAAGDVTGDGRAEVITAPQLAAPPVVHVFDVAGARLLASFAPHPDALGVRVAAGDVTGDGRADLITGPGLGGSPHVRVFDGATAAEIFRGLAFDPSFTGGVFVATTASPSAVRFTSSNAATFNEGAANSFTITTTGAVNPPIVLQTGTLPAGVTLTDHGNGTATLAGTPAAGTGGTHPLTFHAGFGFGVTQNFTLTVNDLPAAANDAYSVNEGGTLTTPPPGVIANDTNIVGTLTASLVAGPAHAATFNLNPDGSFAYVHDGSETPLTDTFTYRINDGTLNSNVATVTITIAPQPDAPVAAGDAYAVVEGGTLSPAAAAGVLANDTDADSSTLTAALVSGPAQAAAFTFNADGSFSYTHNGSETVTDNFTYRASDGGLTSAITTVVITITPVNDAPVATADAVTVNEGATATQAALGLLANDTDAEGSALTAVLVSGPAHAAAFALNADGSFSYTHDGSETPLTDSFTYRANDGSLDSNIVTVTITIVPVNDAPVAVNDAFSVAEGGTLAIAAPGVLGNDSDVDSAGRTAVLVTGPAQAAAFTLNADGSFTYTHNGSETVTDTFTYRANDGALDSNLATVTITITPVNDAPVAVDDGYNVAEGATLSPVAALGVLANDADADSVSLTAVLVAGPAQASAFTLNPDGSFSYTHNGSETVTDSFTYQASDGVLPSNIATVTITITPVNDAPVLDLDANDSGGTSGADFAVTVTENDPATLLEDPADATITDIDSTTLVTLTVTLTNLFDAGQELLDVDLTTGGFDANFTKAFDTVTTPGQGILTIAGIGPQPLADFETLLRRVTYRHTGDNPTAAARVVTVSAFDGTTASNTATSTVTIVPVNDPPVANDDGYNVLEGGTLSPAAATGVLANDTDPDTPSAGWSAVLVTGPAQAATFTLNADGSFTYTHNGVDIRTDSFTYRVNDGSADSNVATVTITIGNVNEPPTAVDDSGSTDEDTVLTVPAAGVLDNDTDPDLLDIRFVSAVNGSGGNVGTTFTLASGALLTVQANGSYIYNPNGQFEALGAGQTATDSFTYTVQDSGSLTSSATVVITINGVNDVPVIDLDADDSSGATGANYTVSYTENDAATLLEDAADAIVTDADHSTLSSLTVTLTNLLAPTFETLSVDLTGFPAFTAPYDTTTTPGIGVLTISAASPQPIADFQALLRTVRYLNTDENPDATARVITFVANDGISDGPAATATVTMTPVNDPPTADNESYTLIGGGTLTVPAPGVLDGDLDPEGLTLTAVLDAGPAHATSFTLNPDGSFTYVHDGTVVPSDSFTYHAHDGALDSTIATVTITFNAPPVAVDDASATTEDAVLPVAAPGVLGNDTDADAGDTKTVAAVNGSPANVGTAITTAGGATLTLNADGSYNYDPTAVAAFQQLGVGQSTTDSFTYVVQDGGGLQDTGLVTITINGVNDTPTVTTSAGNTTFTEDAGAVTIDAGLTITDVDAVPFSSATVTITNLLDAGLETLAAPTLLGGATASYVAPALTISGSATRAQDEAMLQAVTYNNTSQNPNQTQRTISFVANDGTVTSAAANKLVNVAGVNDAPVVTTIVGTTAFIENGGAVVVDGALTVTDPDSANLSSAQVTITNVLNGGAEVLSATACGAFAVNFVSPTLTITGVQSPAVYQACLQSVRYNNTSDAPDTTARSIRFSATDGVTASADAFKSVWVTAVNDPPFVTDATIDYATAGHTQLHVEGKTLPGIASVVDASGADAKAGPFTDPDGPSAPAIVDASGASTNGGAFDIDPNGSFTYVPPLNFTGTDSFTFQVTDGLASTPVTVDIAVSNLVWYVRDIVDADNAAGGDGRSNNALETLTGAVTAATAAPGNNDYIYVFAGDTATTPLTGGVTLADGTRLWGQGIDLDLPGFAGLVTATSAPHIRTTAASTNVVNVNATAASGQNIEIRGLDLEATGATSNAIDVTSGGANLVGVTIADLTVTGATAEGIDVNHGSSGAGTVALSNLTVTATSAAIDLNETAGSLTVTAFSNLTVTGNSDGAGFLVTNATFDATPGGAFNAVNGGGSAVGESGNPVGGAGLMLTNVAGDLTFTGLDLFAGTTGLFVTGTGPINAPAGTGTRVAISSSGSIFQANFGAAVDVTNATIDLPLDSASATSGATGISLVNVADGVSAPASFSAANGSITGMSSAGVSVNGGNATVTYGGSITHAGTGAAVSVSSGHTDTVSFSGTISATAGTGLQFDNADGTYNFTGTTTLNGGDAGIDILNGSTGTFTFGANTAITNPSGTAFLLTGSNAGVTYGGSITDNSGFAVDIDNHDSGTVTFQTGNITSTGTGLRVANSNGGTINFNSPTIALTTTTNAAVTLDTNNAGGTVNFNPGGGGSGLDISTSSGTGFSAAGGGTITVQGAGNSIATTTGTALVINATTVGNGSANGVQFNSVTTNGAANGILLTSVSQGTSSTGVDILGGSIVNASTRGVDIVSTSADVTISSSISSTASGRTVEVTGSGRNVAGGSQIVFSGAIDENGLGINLDDNDQNTNGAVVAFSGGLDIDSTTNTGFNATNGGTVSITGTNTINTTSGTALNIANTNIGASDVTFQSITAGTASDTAGLGISLDNTGSSGGLHVTGTGPAGSGGTIQHKTGANGSTTAGIGIYLNNTADVQLDRMQLNDFQNFAIRASDANGFSLQDSVVNGLSGNDAGSDEGAILFLNSSGTIEITNSQISGGFEDNLRVLYDSATADIATYTITGNIFSDLQSGNNALVNLGSATTASSSSNVTFNLGSSSNPALGNTFDNSANQNPLPPPDTQWFGDGILVTFEGGFQHTINIDNNTFFELFQGIDFAVNFSADVDARIYSNTITYTEGVGAIAFGSGSSSTSSMLFQMLIEDNDIGGLGNDSGSRLGSGIVGDFRGAETARVTIHQNVVRDTEVNPINIISQMTLGQDGDTHLRITNNTIASIDDDAGGGAGVIPGINVTTNAATNGDIFLTISGNTASSINEDGILVRQATVNNTYSLEDFAGDGTNSAAVDSYLESQNPGTTARVRTGGSVVNYTSQNLNNTNTPAPLTP